MGIEPVYFATVCVRRGDAFRREYGLSSETLGHVIMCDGSYPQSQHHAVDTDISSDWADRCDRPDGLPNPTQHDRRFPGRPSAQLSQR